MSQLYYRLPSNRNNKTAARGETFRPPPPACDGEADRRGAEAKRTKRRSACAYRSANQFVAVRARAGPDAQAMAMSSSSYAKLFTSAWMNASATTGAMPASLLSAANAIRFTCR